MNTAEHIIILQGHVYQHIKKKIDNRTLQTREIKKFPLFSEHTSYFCKSEKWNGNLGEHPGSFDTSFDFRDIIFDDKTALDMELKFVIREKLLNWREIRHLNGRYVVKKL